MSNLWTVSPDKDRLELTASGHPFWVEVKRELNIGEQRKIETAGFRGMTGFSRETGDERGTEISIDWRAQSFARTEVYLVNWSLTDGDGNKMQINPDTIRSLRKPVYAAIEKALNDHVKKYDEEKKAEAGAAEPSATSA